MLTHTAGARVVKQGDDDDDCDYDYYFLFDTCSNLCHMYMDSRFLSFLPSVLCC